MDKQEKRFSAEPCGNPLSEFGLTDTQRIDRLVLVATLLVPIVFGLVVRALLS